MMDESKSQNWQTVMPDGLVVDNKDPEKAGRVRVRVAGLHDKYPTTTFLGRLAATLQAVDLLLRQRR